MRRALELARLGQYTAPPNPAVGAVLVREGRVLAEGFHARAGRPHAEAQVLKVGGAARGATLYVNLEPCCHVGRTPPCAERIIASGVRRVVASHPDPDPRVRGGGFDRLRSAGVEVTTGVLRAEARELNPSFFKFLLTGTPWVTVKAAVSVDGVMAPPGTRWITRPRTRRHGRVLRRENDALLTGIATVAADDPLLTPRPRLRARPLLRVILDPSLRIPPEARVLRGLDRDPVLVICAPGAPASARRRLEGLGAEVVEAAVDSAGDGPGEGVTQPIALEAVLAEVGRRGAHTLLVEAGPRLTSAFLQRGLADRLVLYLAPRFLGRADGTGLFDATRAPAEGGRELPSAQPDHRSARYACLGPDLLAEFRLATGVPAAGVDRISERRGETGRGIRESRLPAGADSRTDRTS